MNKDKPYNWYPAMITVMSDVNAYGDLTDAEWESVRDNQKRLHLNATSAKALKQCHVIMMRAREEIAATLKEDEPPYRKQGLPEDVLDRLFRYVEHRTKGHQLLTVSKEKLKELVYWINGVGDETDGYYVYFAASDYGPFATPELALGEYMKYARL